jgi:tetratricopeptide (TPR) repeat protein
MRSSPADLLRRAVEADRKKDFARAARLAAEAAAAEPKNLQAWRLLAVFHEKLGDYPAALDAYEQALSLSPDEAGLARDIARLASLLNIPALAERFLLRARRQDPGSIEIVNDLAYAYCEQSRFPDAIELLRATLTETPGAAMLWNTLGCVLFESGEAAQSLVFFDEAIRLQGDLHAAWFNRANARKAVGDVPGALDDCERAIELGADSLSQNAMYRYARSNLLLNAGDVGAGWDAYAVRNEEAYPGYVHHTLKGPALGPDEPPAGRRLLVVGEQGLGDEVLFANLLPDVMREVGPTGRTLLAVEPRLVTLFQRSFEAAQVVAYDTRREGLRTIRDIPGVADGAYDAWARMGDFLRRYRRDPGDFPTPPTGFLKPDPQAVDRWRSALAEIGPGPKVGVIWRSLLMTSQRQKFYPPLDLWKPVFSAPGLTFINLQAGDCDDELRVIARDFGAEVRTLPGLDLRSDLDGLAALSAALDLVVGPATATTNVAAAVGAPTWFMTTPDAWPRLGTDAFPWYPQVRAFTGAQSYDWPKVLAEVGEALRAEFRA